MRISIIIRTLNEARFLGQLLEMIQLQHSEQDEIETVIVDSGSTDGTLEIISQFDVKLVTIKKEEFSFGRSLNMGAMAATGEIFVMISGHCIPVGRDWVQSLCRPLKEGRAAYSYGRQIGDETSNFSERRIFAKYFPEESQVPQQGFFCNNANSAVLRSAWEKHRFDEEISGLEDMHLAKNLVNDGLKIAYVAEAPVFHLHNESWVQVRRRFEREALALQSIMPEIRFTLWDLMKCVAASTLGDWYVSWTQKDRHTSKGDMLRYRWNQYYGSYKGNHEHRRLSAEMKERYFYPEAVRPPKHQQNQVVKRSTQPNHNTARVREANCNQQAQTDHSN